MPEETITAYLGFCRDQVAQHDRIWGAYRASDDPELRDVALLMDADVQVFRDFIERFAPGRGTC